MNALHSSPPKCSVSAGTDPSLRAGRAFSRAGRGNPARHHNGRRNQFTKGQCGVKGACGCSHAANAVPEPSGQQLPGKLLAIVLTAHKRRRVIPGARLRTPPLPGTAAHHSGEGGASFAVSRRLPLPFRADGRGAGIDVPHVGGVGRMRRPGIASHLVRPSFHRYPLKSEKPGDNRALCKSSEASNLVRCQTCNEARFLCAQSEFMRGLRRSA